MKREPSSPEGYILRWGTVAIRRTWRTLQREVGLLWIVAPWLVFASVGVGVLIARPEGRFQSDGQARELWIALFVGATIAGESALAMSYVLRTGQFAMRTLEYLLASFTLFPLLPWLGSHFIQSSYGNLLWSSRLDLAYLCPVLMLGMVAVYWPYRYLRGWLLVRLPAITRRSQDSCVLQRSDTQLTLRSLMLTITAVAVALSLARTTGSQAIGAYVSAIVLAVVNLATTMPTFGFLLRSVTLLRGMLYAVLYHSVLVPVAFSVLKLYAEPPPQTAWLFAAMLFSFWGGLMGTTVVIGVMLRDAGYRLTAVTADAVDSKRELPEATPQ